MNQSLADIGAQGLSAGQFKMVVGAMNSSDRFYHNYYHLQEMTEIPHNHLEDIETLGVAGFEKFLGLMRIAGFFHDIIYLQADGSVDDKFTKILAKNLRHNGSEWFVTGNDRITDACRIIFDVKPDEPVPSCQINEFLSAIVAARILETLKADYNTIVKVIACIEATVAFRPQADFDRRAELIAKVLPAEEVDEAMYASVYLANKDVYNFSGYDNHSLDERLMRFLQNSWRLTIENSPSVKSEPVYAADFLKAVRANLSFLNALLKNDKYKDIFHHYKNYPAQNKQEYFEERTRELLSYAVVSHSIKFISGGIIGGIDVFDDYGFYPFSLQTDLSYLYIKKFKDGYFAEHEPIARDSDRDKAILDSLTSGKNFPSAVFDGGKAPIGKFLYSALAEEEIMELSRLLYDNNFFSAKDRDTQREGALEYIRKFSASVGQDIFRVIINTLKGVFTQLNNPKRLEYLNQHES